MEIEMAKGSFERRLRDWAAARGYALAIAGTGVIGSIRQKLEERRSAGMIDAAFYEGSLRSFRYPEGSVIEGPRCVVAVARPVPLHVVAVIVGSEGIDALIPPTYVRYNATFADVLADMKENGLERGAEIEIIKVPLKSLAVHMGLVSYGRNNISYAPGLGSGIQLCGYLVGSKEETAGGWADAEGRETMMDRCAGCRACVAACPTGAIREDRFLISAERCFTLHSESPEPFPSWTRPPRSLCLIGCMDCQQVCPENRGRLKAVPARVEFTAKETDAILEAGRQLAAGRPGPDNNKQGDSNPALASARAKFELLGMSEDLEVMGRNLDCLIRRRRSSRRP
jgi:epoxyqueuosine reductase